MKVPRFPVWLLALSFAFASCGNDETPAGPAANPQAAPAVPSPAPSVAADNRPPIAIFKTRPEPDRNGKGIIRGKSPLTIQFNMCASHDLDGDEVLYTHDFDGDGIDELKGFGGSHCRRAFTYVFSHTVQSQRFAPRQCLTDVDKLTGAQLHPKQCAVYVVAVLKK